MSKKNECCKLMDLKSAPKFFKALGDPNRLAIFSRLLSCGKATSVNEVSSCCDVDLSVISRHLKQLKEAEILDSEKNGKEVFYSVNCDEIVASLRELADLIESTNKKGSAK